MTVRLPVIEVEEVDTTTDMEREEGNTTTMMTRDNFHSKQVARDLSFLSR